MILSKRYKLQLATLAFCAYSLFVSQRLAIRSFISSNQHRLVSLYLGNGRCKWTPPSYDPPEGEFHKTLIVGYPSGDKRLTYIQMEALTGLTAKDEWEFDYFGITNYPFIKSNYPHHEGIWGWEQEADQVIMIVRNLRRTIVEYHDILWDIGYAETYDVAMEHAQNLYRESPPLNDFLHWRDEYVIDEIQWYGWFIDYWMEGGLMRDIFSHRITTPRHWNMLMIPNGYSREDVDYSLIVGDDVIVTPSYDPHCLNDVSDGCRPKEIISAERLLVNGTGPIETRKIASVLQGKQGIGDYLIEEDAWDCIWEELIINKKGSKTFLDREGLTERHYNFSEEMLEIMIEEQNRLIAKYTGHEWISVGIAQNLVDIITEHRDLLAVELIEVQSGERRLRPHDFLGPKTRARKKFKMNEGSDYW